MERLITRPKKGLWITVEGITGVGKTFTSSKFLNVANIVSIGEVSDVKDSIGANILSTINELNQNHDIFFSKAPPLTTFFMLSAMHFNQIEQTIVPSLNEGKVIISDRGLDSPALLQSILFHQASYSLENVIETYNFFMSYYNQFTFLPDYTIILQEELDICLKRVNTRIGEKITEQQETFLQRCQDGWNKIGETDRIRYVDSKDCYELIKSIISKYEKSTALDN